MLGGWVRNTGYGQLPLHSSGRKLKFNVISRLSYMAERKSQITEALAE